jgi:plastocyanin
MTRQILGIALIALFCTFPAFAGDVSVSVGNTSGTPAAGAVVALVSDAPAALPATRVPAEAIIDQRHEMFIPLVTLIRKGGRVIFTNNDTTMHQVYSFSPIKQFEFKIDQGERSDPVTFDTAGVAAIGCNIHDFMITYVYVADSPFTAITDAKGGVRFSGVPAGAYHLNVWHPQLMPGTPAPSQALAVTDANAVLTVKLPLLAGPTPGMKPMHMGSY